MVTKAKPRLVSMSTVLSDDQLAVVLLIYRDGFTQQEAADELGWHQGTVSRHHEAAIVILRTYYGELRDNFVNDLVKSA